MPRDMKSCVELQEYFFAAVAVHERGRGAGQADGLLLHVLGPSLCVIYMGRDKHVNLNEHLASSRTAGQKTCGV